MDRDSGNGGRFYYVGAKQGKALEGGNGDNCTRTIKIIIICSWAINAERVFCLKDNFLIFLLEKQNVSHKLKQRDKQKQRNNS